MASLKSLIGKSITWTYDAAQQQIFDKLREWLLFPSATAFPNFPKSIQVFTDASDYGLDAIMGMGMGRSEFSGAPAICLLKPKGTITPDRTLLSPLAVNCEG